MRRCKNCYKSLLNSEPSEFCDPKCEREYGPIDLNGIDAKSAFRLIADAICLIFTQYRMHEKKDIEINRTFLASPIVSSFCDCSDNFEQGRLINYYEKLYTTYKIFNCIFVNYSNIR
jgi:hypothetical protein